MEIIVNNNATNLNEFNFGNISSETDQHTADTADLAGKSVFSDTYSGFISRGQ